jgi:hypothetical protein
VDEEEGGRVEGHGGGGLEDGLGRRREGGREGMRMKHQKQESRRLIQIEKEWRLQGKGRGRREGGRVVRTLIKGIPKASVFWLPTNMAVICDVIHQSVS